MSTDQRSDLFSFTLPQDFLDVYRGLDAPWGFMDVADNSFSELTFLDKYSRVKPDGAKETWVEVCERVINGMYSIQKDHAKSNRLPWNDRKAQASAQEAFDRMFNFKWVPPGRGLWVMGTPLVMSQRNSAALQNCAFVSTRDMTKSDPSKPFAFLMEASMLGIGVGFDTLGADKGFVVHSPQLEEEGYLIPDSREGWVESTKALIDSYLKPNQPTWVFDYSEIRPAGEPIRTFGGTAAGPGPLVDLHQQLRKVLENRAGGTLTSTDITDIANLIGVCVVSGNVRRSAELAMGEPEDFDFLKLKDPSINPLRMHWCDPDKGVPCTYDVCPGPGWGGLSNNSMSVQVGSNYEPFIGNIAQNGEPGLIWMDVSRKYGRLVDPPTDSDYRAMGYNPCAEQTLESFECCTLVETFLPRHDSLEDFQRTLKFAFLYAKTVTLLPTHWPETNAIMQRNRRIGCSVSGVAEFADAKGVSELKTWFNTGYETVRRYDKTYSEWLCVRESVKITSVKPSGTVSLLAGCTPGVHWMPGGEYFLRAQRLSKDSPIVPMLQAAGYTVEPDVQAKETRVVAYFPIHSGLARPESEVTMWEKALMAVAAQRYWADNSVSVTVSFNPETEAQHIGALLHSIEGQLKTISFLPKGNTVYPQQPYTEITKEQYEAYEMQLMPVDFSVLYLPQHAQEAIGEQFCTTDACEVRFDMKEAAALAS